jgi:phage terminase small subunit
MAAKKNVQLSFEEQQHKNIKKIMKNTIALMRQVNTYKPEFDPIIAIYARIRSEYDELCAEYMSTCYKFDEFTDTGGTKKAPIITTLESYRKDILAYASQLGLTPSGLNKINAGSMEPPPKKSPLDRFLSDPQNQ